MDTPKQPFGTRHYSTHVDLYHKTITYQYRVRWWWLPKYWVQMMYATAKEGFHVQVTVRAKAGRAVVGQVREEELN